MTKRKEKGLSTPSRPKTTKPPLPAHSAPLPLDDERRNIGREVVVMIFAIIGALLVALALTWLLPWAQGWRLGTQIVLTLAIVILIVTCALWLYRILTVRVVKAIAVCVVSSSLVVLWLVRPSDARARAETYMGVCHDEMWATERVTCFDSATEAMTNSPTLYFPEEGWNTFDTTKNVEGVAPLEELGLGGPWLASGTVRSVGEVVAVQRFTPNELVVQLRPPTPAAQRLATASDWEAAFPRAVDRGQVEKYPADERKDAITLVYLNVSVRHFFTPAPGDGAQVNLPSSAH